MSRVLVVGSGAREHAILWKLRQSPRIERLYVAPGNAGTNREAESVPLAATDIEGLCRFSREKEIDLVVIGPEAPLALGLADCLRAGGRRVVGPDRAAARIEWSKAFAKDLMERAGVPTARYAQFDSLPAALRYVDEHPGPLVVKADGLAAGKGVTVCHAAEEARAALQAAMNDRLFGDAGNRVVVEEFLHGPEVSLLALVDGERVVPLPLAQDHKRLGDGDTGPNTGGMGAYAPVPFVDDEMRETLLDLTVRPIVSALADMGCPYRGVLFAGLMLTADGPRVLEYNCRLGDPETQVILPLLQGDLLPWLEAVADGSLSDHAPHTSGTAVGVVLAAPGYPDAPRTGAAILGLDEVEAGTMVFHAGTAQNGKGAIVTAGGRVLTVVGVADTFEDARERAYAAPVRFEGMQRRGDIAPHPLSPQGVRGEGLPRIAVLASGEGSNLQALLDACAAGTLPAEIALVVSHRVGARALTRAQAASIPAYTLPLADRKNRVARRLHEEQVLGLLVSYEVDLVVLAGWMLVLSEEFLERCPFPLLNVHPAMLPLHSSPELQEDFPVLRGAHAVHDALALGLQRTGVSVHLVTPEVDAGPVILRKEVPIVPGDTEVTLYRRIKAVEHGLLPQAAHFVLSSSHRRGGVHA